MTTENEKDQQAASQNAANIKLAIFLGVAALGIYAGYLWFYMG